MILDRRRFLKTTLAGSAAVAIGGCSSFASAKAKDNAASGNAKLNLSFQEGTAPGANLREKFDYMEKHGVVGFEPQGKVMLSRLQEMKESLKGRNIKVGDAASICRDIHKPGVKCMGDFSHIVWEENCDRSAFFSAGEHLQHVHVASRKRRGMPGEDGDADDYVNGFKGLKMLGYDKYFSFECGCQGFRDVVVPAALALLRKQWEES